MKRSVQSIFLAIGIILLGFALPQNSFAQGEEVRESKSVSISTTEDGKVKLKVVMKNGSDETTFEKTYDSHDEMYADRDLEKHGIDLGFGHNFQFNGQSPKFFFHNGPSGGFWDKDDFNFEELEEQMREMMRGFDSNAFSFDFDGNSFMDVDSLMNQFQFRNDNGRFFFNGKEIMDMDSLQDALKDQFDHFNFDFDFGDWDSDDFNAWYDKDGDAKVITRAKVYVRSARESDKELVGAGDAEALQLKDINFYPNPSDGRFDLEIDVISDDPIQLIIVDDQGNEVYSSTSSPERGLFEKRIDLSKEGKGLYVLKVEQNGKVLTKRIIVE